MGIGVCYPYGGRQNPRECMYIYIYAKQQKICMLTKYAKQKKGKRNKTDYNKQKGLKAYKSKLKQNKTA